MADSFYDYWRLKDLWELEEGISLLLGVDPKEDIKPAHTIHMILTNQGMYLSEQTQKQWPESLQKQFRNIYSLAESSIEAGLLRKMVNLNTGEAIGSKLYPPVLLSWAQRKGIKIPDELKSMISEERKTGETLKSVKSISDAPVSDSAQDIDAEFEKTLAEYLSKDSPEAYLANSSLSKWLKKEKWKIKEGLLIISGIDPETAKVEWPESGKDEPIKTVLKFGHAFVKSDKFNRRPALNRPHAELDERLLDSEKERFIAECSEVLHHNHDIWLRSDHEALAGKDYIPIAYFLKWADSKKIKVDWLEWANKAGLCTEKQPEHLQETQKTARRNQKTQKTDAVLKALEKLNQKPLEMPPDEARRGNSGTRLRVFNLVKDLKYADSNTLMFNKPNFKSFWQQLYDDSVLKKST